MYNFLVVQIIYYYMLYEYDYDKEIMINEILLDILYSKTWCLIESISGLLVKKKPHYPEQKKNTIHFHIKFT